LAQPKHPNDWGQSFYTAAPKHPNDWGQSFYTAAGPLFRPNKTGNFTDFLSILWEFRNGLPTLNALLEIPCLLGQAKILPKVIDRFETKEPPGRPVLRWTA
jgi:hypothetical protein